MDIDAFYEGEYQKVEKVVSCGARSSGVDYEVGVAVSKKAMGFYYKSYDDWQDSSQEACEFFTEDQAKELAINLIKHYNMDLVELEKLIKGENK